MILDYFSKICRENSHFICQKKRGTLREVQYTFMIITCSILLTMRNVSDESCTENHKILISNNIYILNSRVVGGSKC